jgi:hypothetical protein
MSVSSSWRNAEGSDYPASRTFSSLVEAGITIGGDPAIRLGPMDLTQKLGRRVHAAEGNGQADAEGWSTGMWVVVGLGVLATVGIVAGAIEESKPHPADGSNICDAFYNCHY